MSAQATSKCMSLRSGDIESRRCVTLLLTKHELTELAKTIEEHLHYLD